MSDKVLDTLENLIALYEKFLEENSRQNPVFVIGSDGLGFDIVAKTGQDINNSLLKYKDFRQARIAELAIKSRE